MTMNTTVQLRIDASTKAKAQKVLKELGLDLSSAVKLFLTKVVSSRSIPFEVARTVNGFTPAQEKRLLREAALTRKYGKRFSSTKEMMDDIMS